MADEVWQDAPFINSFTVPRASRRIFPVQPRGHAGPGSITVLCGVNASGKTHLLKAVARAVGSHKSGAPDNSQTDLELTSAASPHAPKLLLFASAAKNKDKSGRIDLALRRSGFDMPADMVNYRRPMLEFFRRELARRFPDLGIGDFSSWVDDVAIRKSAALRLPLEGATFSTDVTDPFIGAIERVLAAQLYYRRCEGHQLELVKRCSDGVLQVYSRWSDGERAVFHVAGMTLLERPHIVLLDEIENHLHPQMISRTLEFMRGFVPQTIIATHHPHVVFSKWIDRIYYLDTKRQQLVNDRPDQLAYHKGEDPAPPRTLESVEDDFDRLASIYGLFDVQDQKLLEQAVLTHANTTIRAANLAREAFASAEPVPGSSRAAPDRQTGMILEWIRGHLSPAVIPRVLDLGAGLGRLVVESAKLGPWSLPQGVEWWCWEARTESRAELAKAMTGRDHVNILNDVGSIDPGSCSVAIIANVLHELTPDVAAGLLACAYEKVLRTDGVLLILEIFPLITPEKFAVPYAQQSLERILLEVGLVSQAMEFSAGGSRAYMLCCRAIRQVDDFQERVRNAIAREWQELLRLAASRYTATSRVDSVDSHRRFLSDMMTMASIVAWQQGLWIQS